MRGKPINRLEQPWRTPAEYGPELTEYHPPARWKRTARNLEENAESFISGHPQWALAGAAVLGLMLGWMIKRR